jgi:protein required for attachment to host cells
MKVKEIWRGSYMDHTLVTVLDGTRARFLTLEPAEFPELESGPNLIEQDALINETNEMQGQDLWSTAKTGRHKGTGGQSHSYDDHRQNHRVEFERKFATQISAKIAELAQSHQSEQVVIAAEPQILGLMRETLSSTLPRHLKVDALAKDICQLKPQELHTYLASKGVLPTRKEISSP